MVVINRKDSQKPIDLFYWSETKFTFKDKENYGDLLSKYLVEKISGKCVKWLYPKKQPWYKWDKQNYLAIGSIIHHATKNSIVWGSGIIDKEQKIAPADFRAVRGPQTRKYLLDKGYSCPEIYGDPALLLPDYFMPQIEKKYKLGIIPHYHDFQEVVEQYGKDEDILVIDMMTMNVENVTRAILSCERTISSSLHGLIVSHAYEIPSVWIKFSNKVFGDDIKYVDYLESVELPVYIPLYSEGRLERESLNRLFDEFPSLPERSVIDKIKKDLIDSCPF